jgi:hypothetical protein
VLVCFRGIPGFYYVTIPLKAIRELSYVTISLTEDVRTLQFWLRYITISSFVPRFAEVELERESRKGKVMSTLVKY